MIQITPIEVSQTASSGIWSFNTQKFSGGNLMYIVLNPTTATTTYDISIIDEKSNTIYNDEGITGLYIQEVYIPLRGVYTISVSNSSVDEAYTGRLMVEE
jgi:hypothetical protein